MSADRAYEPGREPTAPVKPAVRGRGDTPPPVPPHELDQDPAAERSFSRGDEEWIARLAGKGAAGTGSYGLGLIEAVHFFRGVEPDRPVSEALLARGRFDSLFEDELRVLLERAVPIPPPAP